MEPKQKTSRFRMLVEDLLPALGTQEGKIARWMLEHEKELVDTPIKDIAINCGVSQPSVVRFCKKLGCNGIKDLKILVDGMRSDTENSIPCTFDDSDKDIISDMFSNAKEIYITYYDENCKDRFYFIHFLCKIKCFFGRGK